MKPSLFQRFLWFLNGLPLRPVQNQETILNELIKDDNSLISERRKYTSLGLALLCSCLISCVSFFYIFFLLFDSYALALFFTSLFAAIFLNLQRFILTINRRKLGIQEGVNNHKLPGYVGLFLSIALGFVISIPLQILVLRPSIDFASGFESNQKTLSSDTLIRAHQDKLRPLIMSWLSLHEATKVSHELNLPEIPELPECLLGNDSCIRATALNIQVLLDEQKGITDKKSLEYVNLSYVLLSREIQLESLRQIKAAESGIGIIRMSQIAFEVEPFFSLLIIFTVILIQTTPGVVRLTSSPSAFDYLISEHDQLAVARGGIEMAATVVFNRNGEVIPSDRFHTAELELITAIQNEQSKITS